MAGTNRTGGAGGAGGSRTTVTLAGLGGSAAGGVVAAGGLGAGGAVITGGQLATGGITGTAGAVGLGGAATGGSPPAGGGSPGTGGMPGTGGRVQTGGSPGTGGFLGAGGSAVGTGGSATGGTTATCGNGTIDPGEQCDLGAGNEDAPAFLVTQAERGFAATPIVRAVSSAEFYDYRSASSHTGMEEAGSSRILLFVNSSALELALVVFHGIDLNSSGVEQPDAKVRMQFDGLPETTVVSVDDDDAADELWMPSPTTATGFWNFANNTDGGAISGLPFPGDWEISVTPSFDLGILFWTWAQSESSYVLMDLAQPLVIKAHSIPSPCRSDCTIPRCGDGILDGGEICDHGGRSGSGCSADCKSFE